MAPARTPMLRRVEKRRVILWPRTSSPEKSGERGERAVDVDDDPPRVEDRHAFRTVLIDRGGEARLRLGASLGRDARIYRRAADDAGDEKQSVERRQMRCDRAPVGAIIAVGEADDQRQREADPSCGRNRCARCRRRWRRRDRPRTRGPKQAGRAIAPTAAARARRRRRARRPEARNNAPELGSID